jgi:hypothetical protein
MQQREPTPRFVECAWYERVASIMRTDPKRFFLFSPQTKYVLSVYLNLKDQHEREQQQKAA